MSMSKDEFKKLKKGDVIRGDMSGYAFTVHEVVKEGVVAVRTVLATTPDEWTFIPPER